MELASSSDGGLVNSPEFGNAQGKPFDGVAALTKVGGKLLRFGLMTGAKRREGIAGIIILALSSREFCVASSHCSIVDLLKGKNREFPDEKELASKPMPSVLLPCCGNRRLS